jgi:hypothetical protein
MKENQKKRLAELSEKKDFERRAKNEYELQHKEALQSSEKKRSQLR